MKLRHFLNELDEIAIADAIQSAEQHTTGRIRVFVSGRHLRHDNIMHRAIARFKKLGLTDSGEQPGILLYLVPLDRRFAILAGHDIYEHCGNTCWTQLALKVEEFLQREQFNRAVLHAVQEFGKLLAQKFPPTFSSLH
jgi:uncharacterized membrane protein